MWSSPRPKPEEAYKPTENREDDPIRARRSLQTGFIPVKSDNEARVGSDRKDRRDCALITAKYAKLNMSPCVHTQPIDLAVCKGLYSHIADNRKTA